MAELPEEDPLAALRGHVRSAQEVAERLARQAAGASGAGGAAAGPTPPGTPPSGWETPPEAHRAEDELRDLVALLGSLRAALPEDLREQVNALIRQVLLLARAIIDWLVARIESDARGREIPVQDIPIS